jgi:hypothetical protein
MTMTVEELRNKLADYPDDMPVYTEGCDCHGEAGSLETMKNYDWDGTGQIDALLISRSSEKARLKYEKEMKQREIDEEKLAAEQRARGLIA